MKRKVEDVQEKAGERIIPESRKKFMRIDTLHEDAEFWRQLCDSLRQEIDVWKTKYDEAVSNVWLEEAKADLKAKNYAVQVATLTRKANCAEEQVQEQAKSLSRLDKALEREKKISDFWYKRYFSVVNEPNDADVFNDLRVFLDQDSEDDFEEIDLTQDSDTTLELSDVD